MAVETVRDEQRARAERDLEAIARYRCGDAHAFDELVRSYEPQVQRILAHLNVPACDIEDLAQDVFLRIYRNLHLFRGQSSFYTWLYRVTINVFFDHNKKRKRADARLQRLQHSMRDASVHAPQFDDPFHAASDAIVAQSFRTAIERLPEAFREVVAMREVDDLTYEEISIQTGISIGTVRSRLSRARARLKALLAPALEVAAA